MRTTASYDLFPDARSERALARARWLAREGRTRDAETAYDELLAAQPDLKAGWAEYFELLRSTGRGEEALQLADRARATLSETGFSLTLRGAALTELGRYPEAQECLAESLAIARDLADKRRIAEALQPLGMAHLGQGDLDCRRRVGSPRQRAGAKPSGEGSTVLAVPQQPRSIRSLRSYMAVEKGR